MEQERINCMRCQYYYVTWDRYFPKGCKAYAFKSANIPSVEVLRSSGQPCMKFIHKKSVRP